MQKPNIIKYVFLLLCFYFIFSFSKAEVNKPDSNIYFLEKTLAVANKNGNLKKVAECYEKLSNAYALKNNFMKAYNYHLQYSIVSDSLFNTEKKTQQAALVDEQNKTKSLQKNLFIAGSIILLLSLFVLGFYYLQRNKIAKKNLKISAQTISNLLKEQEIKSYNAMIEGQEEERKRIAGDLHDRLGSMLSTVKLLFSSIDTKDETKYEENKKQYENVNNLLDEAVVEVRRISHNLSTGMVISFGLVAALQELCESIDKTGLIKCKLLVYGMNERLDQQTEIGVYRMIQELFNNILKHANAKKIIVQINRVDDSVNITVEDDGIGFNIHEKNKNGGMGFGNLQSRAAKLNGTYYVDSKTGRGTISIIEIPLNKTEL